MAKGHNWQAAMVSKPAVPAMATDELVVSSSEEDVLPIGNPPGPAKVFWYDAKLQAVVRHDQGSLKQLSWTLMRNQFKLKCPMLCCC